MKTGSVLAVVVAVLLAGCSGVAGDAGPRTTFDLTVQNDGSTSVPVLVTVTNEAGDVVQNANVDFASGVGGTFELAVDGGGRYMVVLTADDWETAHQLDADLCERYEGITSFADAEISSSSECITLR